MTRRGLILSALAASSAALAASRGGVASAFSPSPPPLRLRAPGAASPRSPLPPLRASSEEAAAGGVEGGGGGGGGPNPLASLFSSLLNAGGSAPAETEEERARRLKMERYEQISASEVRRAARVREDAIPYLSLLAIQFLPLLGSERNLSVAYFWVLACATVYVGGRQETIDEPEVVSKQSAMYAPLGASASILLLYVLIQNGLDPGALYAVIVVLFGAISISDVGVPILRGLLPESFAEAEVDVPAPLAKRLDLDPPTLPLDGLVALAVGLSCAAAYWAPGIGMEDKFLVSNFLAWALGMTSLAAISLGSFQTGALLLLGLFCYDIFWVFGTDVMMTVATKVEAPIKFLFTAPPSDVPRSYPFSVLGLGDVVIPGLFVSFMATLDRELKPKNVSYFQAGTAAYAVGLGLCFVVNEITHAGQPALLYLDPACVGTALACAKANGQLDEVWNFEEGRPQVADKA